jgi:hypothetical protein
MLHVARLHVFNHVTLVGLGVAAVKTVPAVSGLCGTRERDLLYRYSVKRLITGTGTLISDVYGIRISSRPCMDAKLYAETSVSRP